MATKNSQSRRVALANMLKQRPGYNQRMEDFMSLSNAARANQGQLRDGGYNNMLPYSSSASLRPGMTNNTYNPSAQPTGPTGLTSNFYDPSYGIDRGFADQMTARNKAMQGMDSGQIQYDPVNKSFFSVGAMGQRGGPALQGTYDQMYRKYDVQNQLRGLGTPSSLTPMQQASEANQMAQAGTNPFNAAQIDFMNKNQDVFGPSPSEQNANKLQAAKAAQTSQGGLSQLNTPNRPLRSIQGDDSPVGGKVNQPMPSTGLPKLTDAGFGDARNFANNGVTPANAPRSVNMPLNTQASSAGLAALGSGLNMGQATQNYPKQSQAPARRPASRGKLNQLMPPPSV